jgi:hypothetical protein
MTTQTPTIQAERAHAQSIVISANLEHLATRVSEFDPELRDDLKDYAAQFDAYVRRIGAACEAELDAAMRQVR